MKDKIATAFLMALAKADAGRFESVGFLEHQR